MHRNSWGGFQIIGTKAKRVRRCIHRPGQPQESLRIFLTSNHLAGATDSKPMTSSADSPTFIVGMSRSGTTLLARMLDAHSEIAILPETWSYVVLDRLGCIEEFTDPWQTSLFFNEVWENLKGYRDPAAQIVASVAAKELGYVGPTVRLLEKLGQAYANERHARYGVRRQPAHALWLQIRDLFPRARVLFMVRDPDSTYWCRTTTAGTGRRIRYVISTAALLKFYLVHLLHHPGFPPGRSSGGKISYCTTVRGVGSGSAPS